jgi:hypothetical protein
MAAARAGVTKRVGVHTLRHNSECPIIPNHRPIVACYLCDVSDLR